MWQELLTPILETENPNQDWINDWLVCYESETGDNSLWGIGNVGIIFTIIKFQYGSSSRSSSWSGYWYWSWSGSWSRYYINI